MTGKATRTSAWIVVLLTTLLPASLGHASSPISPTTVPCPGIIALSPETMSLDPPPHIDCPGISAGTFLGGSGEDYAIGVAVDPLGFRYVTGYTASPGFPTTPGAFDTSFNGNEDAFVVKLNPSGAMIYSSFLGGLQWDEGLSLAVDTNGNAYVTGTTNSDDFPTTNTAAFPTYSGTQDAFVVKLDPDGQVVYSSFLGGNGEDVGWSIALDAAGSAYVTGYTLSTDFPTTSQAYAKPGSLWQAFVTKLNPGGSAIVYSTLLGGSNAETAEGIAVDSNGNVFLTGATSSPDFPITQGGVEFGGGSHDDFVLKLDPTGNALLFSTLVGGSDYEDANGIAVDGQGNVYVGGFTRSPDFPTSPGAFDRLLGGPADAYVVKLNGTGDRSYSTLLGGEEYDDVWAIAVDEAGQVHVTGETYSDGFPTTEGALDATHNSDRDAYIAKLDPSGTGLVYSTFLGGAVEQPDSEAGDLGTSVAIDATGNATVVGGTTAPDFPVTEGSADTTYNGGVDAFLITLKLVPEPNRPPVAWFEVNQSSDHAGRIFANASRSADAEDITALLEVRWDWEDDGVWDTGWSTAKLMSHDYTSAGRYTVRLEVRDTSGLTSDATHDVVVTSVPPVIEPLTVNMTVEPAVPPPPRTFTFTSTPAGGTPPYSFLWDFGDGSTSNVQNPAHTYTVDGTYFVHLTVTDAEGRNTTKSIGLDFHGPPPGGILLWLLVSSVAIAVPLAGILIWRRLRRPRVPPGQ